MQGEGLIEKIGAEKGIIWNGKLKPDQERENACKQHEYEGRTAVPQADFAIVDRCPVAPARGGFPHVAQALILRLALILRKEGAKLAGHFSPFR